MKKFSIFLNLIFFVFISNAIDTRAVAALDCSDSTVVMYNGCSPQPTGIISNPWTYTYWDTGTCCRRNCGTNAQLSGTTCICSANYIPNGANACKLCPTGYPYSEAGATSDSDCYKSCTTTDITVANGICNGVESAQVSHPNKCTYNISCNTGYYGDPSTQETSYTCTPNTIDITYNSDGGDAITPTTTSCLYNGDFTLPGQISKSGHVFDGWKNPSGTRLGAAGDTVACSALGATSGTATVTAMWAQCGKQNAATYHTDTCDIATCNTDYYLVGTGSAATCEICGTLGKYCENSEQKDCEKGYYCKNGKTRTACPPGKTTDNTGSPSADECHYVTVSEAGGASANATQFCDGSGTHCFTLP